MFEALVQPHRDQSRPWLFLTVDEQDPEVVQAHQPDLVVWSSLWPSQPTATIRFEILPDGGSATSLTWMLSVDGPPPDDAIVHMRKRINTLINGNLRSTFGQ